MLQKEGIEIKMQVQDRYDTDLNQSICKHERDTIQR